MKYIVVLCSMCVCVCVGVWWECMRGERMRVKQRWGIGVLVVSVCCGRGSY